MHRQKESGSRVEKDRKNIRQKGKWDKMLEMKQKKERLKKKANERKKTSVKLV